MNQHRFTLWNQEVNIPSGTNQQRTTNTEQQINTEQINNFSFSPPNFLLLPFNFLLGSSKPMDFTFKTYENLLNTLLSRGFSFLTFTQYIEAKFHTERRRSASSLESLNPESSNLESLNLESLNLIILRHDVEARYPNALRMAQIQHKLGIKGTYYFRIFNKSGNEAIIKQIAALGHEIGYHYDDLTACKGDHQKAIERFQKNLAYLRQFATVRTICMEGAPESKYNNQDLWGKEEMRDERREMSRNDKTLVADTSKHTLYHTTLNAKKSYRDFGIIAEPYFDLNFDKVYYLTDTGRRWDGKFSVRDKAVFRDENVRDGRVRDERVRGERVSGEKMSGESVRGEKMSGERVRDEKLSSELVNPEYMTLRFRHTKDIIKAIEESSFPSQAMLTFHPQRWNDKPMPWLKEFVWQNVKNQVKRIIVNKSR